MKCSLSLHLIKAGTHSTRTSRTTRSNGETASHEERQGRSQLVRASFFKCMTPKHSLHETN